MDNLIILHGWASSPDKWIKFKQLFKDINLYIPQLPGFTKPLDKAWDLDDYCTWLDQYIQKKDLKNIILLGHSFGGRIAISFCSRYPGKVKKMILVNSAGIVESSFKKDFFRFIAKTGKRFFSLPILKSLKKSARWILYMLAREKDYFQASEVMQKTMQRIINYDLRKDAASINIPVLIIWGKADRLTPLRYAGLFAEHIKNSQLVVIDSQGHGLPIKNPQLIDKQIKKFIKD